MATRQDLAMDGDDGLQDSGPDNAGEVTEPDPGPKTKRLKKGWKDPADPIAKGKFKTAKGNIREDF